MNIVQRYILKEVFPFFIFGNFFFMFLLIAERIVNVAELFLNKNVPISILLKTIVYITPSVFFMTIPLAALLSTLITFSRLSADSELVAMRSIGASNTSLMKPLIYFGIFAAILNFVIGAYFIEKGSKLALNNLNSIVEKISINDLKSNQMYTEIPDIILYVKEKVSNSEFKDLILISEKQNLLVNAHEAKITPTDSKSMEMLFHDGTFTLEDKKGELSTVVFDNMSLNLPLNVNISEAVDSPMTMSLKELYNDISNPRSAFELNKRISTPLSTIIMILFGFSLGMFLSRSGKSFGLLISIGIAFLYNVLMLYFENSAGQNFLNPGFSAWIPLIIFIFILAHFLRKSFR